MKQVVFNFILVLCWFYVLKLFSFVLSNFVCSCQPICWMILWLLSWCGDAVARNSKRDSRSVFILYSRKVSCRKFSLSRTRCAGRGLELVPLRFPLVPLNWIFRWYQEKPLGSLTKHNWISHKDKWRTIIRVNGFIVMIMVSGLCQHQSQVMLWKRVNWTMERSIPLSKLHAA